MHFRNTILHYKQHRFDQKNSNQTVHQQQNQNDNDDYTVSIAPNPAPTYKFTENTNQPILGHRSNHSVGPNAHTGRDFDSTFSLFKKARHYIMFLCF